MLTDLLITHYFLHRLALILPEFSQVYVRPNLLCWCSKSSEIQVKLFQITISSKDYLSCQQFCEDASYTPNIHWSGVLLPQNNLRCPVPKRHHFLCVNAIRHKIGACEAKVSNFEIAWINV